MGGGPYYALLGGSRICDSNRVDKSLSDDADVTDWTRTDDFILAVNIYSGGKDTDSSQHKLRWRNVTTNGSFADVEATGEIHYNADTVLVNGAAIVVGDRRCASQGDTWQNGREVEGASLSSAIDLADDYETEIHFGLDCSGGSFLNEYEFELWNTTEGASKGTCGATITLGIDSSAEIIYGEVNPVLGEVKKSWYVWQNVDGDQPYLVGGDVISADYSSAKIYKHNGFSDTITDSFSSPSSEPVGLTWDGTNLFSSDNALDKIYKHTGFSSTITDSFSSPSTAPRGLTWDGTNLLSIDYDSAKIYKHTGFSDTITDSFSSPSISPIGLTWDGDNLLSTDIVSDKIYKHTGFSSTITDSFSSPSTSPRELSWDGDNLLSTDDGPAKIYKHNGFSDTIIDSFSSPFSTIFAITMDNSYAKIRESVALSPVEQKGIGKYIRVIVHRYGSGYSNYEVYLRGHHSTSWEQTAGSSNLISVDNNSDKIYKHLGFSDTITDSFSSPSTIPNGLAWDGTNVLSSDGGTNDKIYKHTGFSSTISDSFSPPSDSPTGLAWDGTNLLSADSTTDKIYKHTGFSNTIIDSFSSPSTVPYGLAWDGTNLLSADNSFDIIYKHAGFTSVITDSFSSPSTSSWGLAWDGTNLLSTDYDSDKIYKHTGFSSSITDSFSSPSINPTGLTWAGPTDWELYIEEVQKDWKHVQVKLVAT